MNYSNRLKELKKALKLTTEQLSKDLNMPARTLGSYERNESKIPLELLTKLCKEYAINPLWFSMGQGDMFITPETSQFEECDDNGVLKNFKNLHERFTQMLADLNTTDYKVSKRTGISESRLEKIGLGDAVFTMEEFLKLRSKYVFDANWLLFNKEFNSNNSNADDELSADEIAALKKLAKKFT